AEAILRHYKDGKLNNFELSLKELGLKAEEIERRMSSISFEGIKSIMELGEFIPESSMEGDLKTLYTKEKGRHGFCVVFPVSKGEVCQQEGIFSKEFKSLIEGLNCRLGGKFVRNQIYDLSDYGITISLGKQGKHFVGEVWVKDNVYASIESTLKELNDSDDSDKINKMKHIFDMLFKLRGEEESKEPESFIEELSKKGVTGKFNFQSLAYRLVLDDQTGEEVIIVNDPQGLGLDASGYDATNYTLEKMTALQLPHEAVDYYNNKLISQLPNKEIFKERYFEKGLDKCSRVIEPYDKDSEMEQTESLTRSIDGQALINILHGYYAEEREQEGLDRRGSFLVWVKLYQSLLEELERQTEKMVKMRTLLGKLYDEVVKNPEIVEDGKWKDVFESLAEKKKMSLTYPDVMRVEMFEKGGENGQRGNDGKGQQSSSSPVREEKLRLIADKLNGRVVYMERDQDKEGFTFRAIYDEEDQKVKVDLISQKVMSRVIGEFS
ncbi:MAG: hypothetical protein KAQ85_08880, partial [Thermodesulfovibrionia bacterium]|nr:hypothetical protein [Thermodesulfovibrionia bacterium]